MTTTSAAKVRYCSSLVDAAPRKLDSDDNDHFAILARREKRTAAPPTCDAGQHFG